MTDIDACDLLRRCLAGQVAGDWQQLIDRYGGDIRRIVRQVASRRGLQLAPADLDEMVQDFYCRLLSARGRTFGGKTEDEIWRYVKRVAQSLVVDRQRSTDDPLIASGGDERDRGSVDVGERIAKLPESLAEMVTTRCAAHGAFQTAAVSAMIDA